MKYSPLELKQRFEKGENITSLLRQASELEYNSDEIIELAYDLQSGSYVDGVKEDPVSAKKKWVYMGELSELIQHYAPRPKSLFKGGAGECVTLVPLLKQLGSPVQHIRGLDLCWSRLAYGRKWLKENKLSHAQLATGTLSAIPFIDRAFDIVVTSHSMEPNGGREEEILKELYRIAGRYLFLSEPNYELANDEGKARMDRLGYIRGLQESAERLGYNVIENRQLEHSMNPLNPTSVLVISKGQQAEAYPDYACPISKQKLLRYQSCYYSEQNLCAYPIIEEIPCLRKSSSVICSKLPELTESPP